MGHADTGDKAVPSFLRELKGLKVIDVGCGEKFTVTICALPGEIQSSKAMQEFRKKNIENIHERLKQFKQFSKFQQKRRLADLRRNKKPQEDKTVQEELDEFKNFYDILEQTNEVIERSLFVNESLEKVTAKKIILKDQSRMNVSTQLLEKEIRFSFQDKAKQEGANFFDNQIKETSPPPNIIRPIFSNYEPSPTDRLPAKSQYFKINMQKLASDSDIVNSPRLLHSPKVLTKKFSQPEQSTTKSSGNIGAFRSEKKFQITTGKGNNNVKIQENYQQTDRTIFRSHDRFNMPEMTERVDASLELPNLEGRVSYIPHVPDLERQITFESADFNVQASEVAHLPVQTRIDSSRVAFENLQTEESGINLERDRAQRSASPEAAKNDEQAVQPFVRQSFKHLSLVIADPENGEKTQKKKKKKKRPQTIGTIENPQPRKLRTHIAIKQKLISPFFKEAIPSSSPTTGKMRAEKLNYVFDKVAEVMNTYQEKNPSYLAYSQQKTISEELKNIEQMISNKNKYKRPMSANPNPTETYSAKLKKANHVRTKKFEEVPAFMFKKRDKDTLYPTKTEGDMTERNMLTTERHHLNESLNDRTLNEGALTITTRFNPSKSLSTFRVRPHTAQSLHSGSALRSPFSTLSSAALKDGLMDPETRLKLELEKKHQKHAERLGVKLFTLFND